jgi:trimeric autotransporter adhesin
MNITDLTGIEAFTNFSQLYCNNNQITGVIDLSNSPNVIVVWCGANLISGLNLSANTALIDLRCSSNPNLTSLDLSNNTALQVFMATNTMITSMDLSNNPATYTIHYAIIKPFFAKYSKRKQYKYNIV